MSVPNQKIIRIEKDKYQSRFLQIGDEQWKKAFQSMRPTVFGLYLYLASNKDGYLLELSAATVERKIGIKKTAYHTALKDLEEKGYLKKEQGNTYAFSPSPKFATYVFFDHSFHSLVNTHLPPIDSKPNLIPPMPANRSINVKAAMFVHPPVR